MKSDYMKSLENKNVNELNEELRILKEEFQAETRLPVPDGEYLNRLLSLSGYIEQMINELEEKED